MLNLIDKRLKTLEEQIGVVNKIYYNYQIEFNKWKKNIVNKKNKYR